VVGVAIDSVEDFGRLLEGFDPAELSLGLIADRVGPVLLAMYAAHADAAGVPHERLRGSSATTSLTDFYSSKTPMFPPRDCVRVMVDCIRFCLAELPQMNALRIGAYNTRESGSTAVQEVAYNLAIAADVLHAAVTAGVPAGEVAARVNFQFSQGPHLFEEVAKIRAARRMWARLLRERFGVVDDRACRMKIHAQTAGVSSRPRSPQQRRAWRSRSSRPRCRVSRASTSPPTTRRWASPPRRRSGRGQDSKIVMHETGVADVADPRGAYYLGGADRGARGPGVGGLRGRRASGRRRRHRVRHIEREIAHAAGRYYVEVERGERVVVGVNRFVEPEGGPPVPVLRPTRAWRRWRPSAWRGCAPHATPAATALLWRRSGRRREGPLMPRLSNAAARATLGEIMGSLTEVFGEFLSTRSSRGSDGAAAADPPRCRGSTPTTWDRFRRATRSMRRGWRCSTSASSGTGSRFKAALEEDVDLIACRSSRAATWGTRGAPRDLRAHGAGHVPVVVGGIIPEDDVPALQALPASIGCSAPDPRGAVVAAIREILASRPGADGRPKCLTSDAGERRGPRPTLGDARARRADGLAPPAGRTRSGIPLKPVCGPGDSRARLRRDRDAGRVPVHARDLPARYQHQPGMSQLCPRLRAPEDTRTRMDALLARVCGYAGNPVFNLVFDLPSQAGYDPDHPEAEGRVGQSGVSVATVDDLATLFEGLPLDRTNASFIVGEPSIVVLSMYVVMAE
jgi:methylmalonyl-CoA mutase N-terminal domain/subunit